MKKKIFWAARKPSNRGEIQGIVFPDGSVALGDDVWRMLDKHDCTSHPVRYFPNLSAIRKEFKIIPIRHGHYYLPGEGKEEQWITT